MLGTWGAGQRGPVWLPGLVDRSRGEGCREGLDPDQGWDPSPSPLPILPSQAALHEKPAPLGQGGTRVGQGGAGLAYLPR